MHHKQGKLKFLNLDLSTVAPSQRGQLRGRHPGPHGGSGERVRRPARHVRDTGGVTPPLGAEDPGADDADHAPMSEAEFEQAVKSILLRPIRKLSRWENREPTTKEKSVGFKLVKRK